MFERICWVSCTCKSENVHLLWSPSSQKPNSEPTRLIAVQIPVWPCFLWHYFPIWCCFSLLRGQILTAVICVCTPNFHASKALTLKKYRLANHHWAYIVFEYLLCWISDSTCSLPLLHFFQSCSAATTQHTQTNLHPSDKHTVCCITVWSADICRGVLIIFTFARTRAKEVFYGAFSISEWF